MKAMILERPAPIDTRPLRLVERAVPRPGRGEVLIKVGACGVCRSNLHMIEGDWVRNGEVTGETVDGGFAEYVLARERHIYVVPESISDAEAAPLFCPGITAFSAVAKARLAPGRTLAVFGFGGVGHMVQQLAQLAGADVTVVARSVSHLALARKLGAARTIDLSTVAADEALLATGGVDAAILFAPSSALLKQAIHGTKPGGIIVVGAFAEVGELPFVEEKTVVGTLLGSREQMRELLRLAGAGKIHAVVESFPLAEAGDALLRLKHEEFEARGVLVP